MSNQYNVGQNQFPEDIAAAYDMILRYKSDTKSKKKEKPSPKSDDGGDSDGDKSNESFVNNGLNSNESNIYTEPNCSTSVDNNDAEIIDDDDDSDSDSISHRWEDTEHEYAVDFLLDRIDDDPNNSDSDLDDFDYPDFGFLQAGTSVSNSSPSITTHQNLGHIFVHSKFLNPNWILLDNLSTFHIFQFLQS